MPSRRQRAEANQAGIVETIQEKSIAIEEFIHETKDLLPKVVP
jgi:hypothetical protein